MDDTQGVLHVAIVPCQARRPSKGAPPSAAAGPRSSSRHRCAASTGSPPRRGPLSTTHAARPGRQAASSSLTSPEHHPVRVLPCHSHTFTGDPRAGDGQADPDVGAAWAVVFRVAEAGAACASRPRCPPPRPRGRSSCYRRRAHPPRGRQVDDREEDRPPRSGTLGVGVHGNYRSRGLPR
jgi:hypothetical protein